MCVRRKKIKTPVEKKSAPHPNACLTKKENKIIAKCEKKMGVSKRVRKKSGMKSDSFLKRKKEKT